MSFSVAAISCFQLQFGVILRVIDISHVVEMLVVKVVTSRQYKGSSRPLNIPIP
jgi:hypothetical protein